MIDRSNLPPCGQDPMFFFENVSIPSAYGPRRFGDVMTPFQRKVLTVLAVSLLALSRYEIPPVTRFFLDWTKGAGKGLIIALVKIWLLAFSPRAVECQLGAADRDQAAEPRKEMRELLALNPILNEAVRVDNWQIVSLKTDSVCDIIAADVAGSHGARPACLVLDELVCITKQEFALNLMDNASKVPHGIVMIATNSGFIDSWQDEWRRLAMESPRWFYHSVAEPAPWIDADEIEEARKRNTHARFMRLWYGVWSTGEGTILNPDDVAAALTLDSAMPAGIESIAQSYIGGIDLSATGDHTGLVMMGLDFFRGRIRLSRCHSWVPSDYEDGLIPFDEVKETIRQWDKLFTPLGWVADPWGMHATKRELRFDGIQMELYPSTSQNCARMANALLSVFSERMIDLYRDDMLLGDLGLLRIVESVGGYKIDPRRSKMLGHADRAMAMCLTLPFCLGELDLGPPEGREDNFLRRAIPV